MHQVSAADEELDPASVRERLGLGGETAEWLASLPGMSIAAGAPLLPDRDDARAVLARLAVPAAQIEEAIRALAEV